MAQNVTWPDGTQYTNVPFINLPKTGGGQARFTDVSPTNAVEADVTQGKTFFKADGSQATGTNQGGGGSSKNVQVAQSTTRSTSTTYTEVVSLTCEVSGTYDVYWSTHRSSTSGTWGSQLYLDNTAHGSAQTGSWSNHIQNIHLTGVQIDAGEEVAVRVRSRGSNYYGYVGTLTIKQTA